MLFTHLQVVLMCFVKQKNSIRTNIFIIVRNEFKAPQTTHIIILNASRRKLNNLRNVTVAVHQVHLMYADWFHCRWRSWQHLNSPNPRKRRVRQQSWWYLPRSCRWQVPRLSNPVGCAAHGSEVSSSLLREIQIVRSQATEEDVNLMLLHQ